MYIYVCVCSERERELKCVYREILRMCKRKIKRGWDERPVKSRAKEIGLHVSSINQMVHSNSDFGSQAKMKMILYFPVQDHTELDTYLERCDVTMMLITNLSINGSHGSWATRSRLTEVSDFSWSHRTCIKPRSHIACNRSATSLRPKFRVVASRSATGYWRAV